MTTLSVYNPTSIPKWPKVFNILPNLVTLVQSVQKSLKLLFIKMENVKVEVEKLT